MEASRARSGYLDFSKLHPGEFFGMGAALLLAGSLFLPWFSTSDSNPNSTIDGQTGNLSAFDVYGTLHWWLLAACSAPFILSWIIARGHKLTWRPGEVTMIVGITAAMLIVLNGVILGKPGDSVEVGFAYGYFIALLAALGICAGGFMRQSQGVRGRKPPGTL